MYVHLTVVCTLLINKQANKYLNQKFSNKIDNAVSKIIEDKTTLISFN